MRALGAMDKEGATVIPCSYLCLLKENRVRVPPSGSPNALHSPASFQEKNHLQLLPIPPRDFPFLLPFSPHPPESESQEAGQGQGAQFPDHSSQLQMTSSSSSQSMSPPSSPQCGPNTRESSLSLFLSHSTSPDKCYGVCFQSMSPIGHFSSAPLPPPWPEPPSPLTYSLLMAPAAFTQPPAGSPSTAAKGILSRARQIMSLLCSKSLNRANITLCHAARPSVTWPAPPL